MNLTPSSVRLDLKCGRGSISKGEKCTKGPATAVKPNATSPKITQGLERGTTAQLSGHRQALLDKLVKNYGKPITNQSELADFDKWAAKQPLQAEINAVNTILAKRRSSRRDAFIGNKKLNCGPGSKPCGNACIPQDHQCRASWNKPVKVAAGAAALGGAALVGTALFHPKANMRRAARELFDPLTQAGFGAANVAAGNFPGAAVNFSKAALAGRELGPNLRTLGKGYSSDIRALYNKGRNAAFKAVHHRPAKRRDSIWASSFSPEPDTYDI